MWRVYHFSIGGIQKVYLLCQKWYTKGWGGGGLSVKSNIRAFNTYMEIKQVKEKVHDSRRSSTAFRDQRFCLFKSRISGLHLETRLDDLDVIVNPPIRDLMILRDSVNVVLNITNNQCPIRRTSFIFWNVEKIPWHKKFVICSEGMYGRDHDRNEEPISGNAPLKFSSLM